MANRRMFSLDIIDSDAFMDMPLSTQALYFHLAMRADDDGFVNNPRKIQRMVNSPDDDLKLLIAKQFIIPFKSGVVVIKHWKIHNLVRSDRYKETVNLQEKAMLSETANKSYIVDSPDETTVTTVGIPDGNQMETQVRLGQGRLEQVSPVKDNTICAEPESGSAPPPVISLPLIDGTEFGVTQEDIDKYASLYPAVDILQELRGMLGWLDANPNRRKTRKGIRRFINNWLSQEQDRGGSHRQQSRPQRQSQPQPKYQADTRPPVEGNPFGEYLEDDQ